MVLVAIIEFPTIAELNAWYTSQEHQDILPIRLENITGRIITVEGMPLGA